MPEIDRRTRTRLRRLAAKYETATFADGDPIRFLRTASGPGVETMAFVAACLSYGSRRQFLPKIQALVDMAGGDVHGWILEGRYARRFRAGDGRSFYRLFSYGRMHELFAALRALLRRHGGLGAFLRANGATTAPAALCALCGAFAGKAAPIVPKDNLGLVGTNAATMRTALEITARLAEAFPGDPCRGDFALYGLGIDEEAEA